MPDSGTEFVENGNLSNNPVIIVTKELRIDDMNSCLMPLDMSKRYVGYNAQKIFIYYLY